MRQTGGEAIPKNWGARIVSVLPYRGNRDSEKPRDSARKGIEAHHEKRVQPGKVEKKARKRFQLVYRNKKQEKREMRKEREKM